MPFQWRSDDLEDVSFNVYLSVGLPMDDEQVSELIYLCRKSHIGVEQVYPTTDCTYVNIVVNNRKQIAQIIRDLRMQFNFPRISRLALPPAIMESSQAS